MNFLKIILSLIALSFLCSCGADKSFLKPEEMYLYKFEQNIRLDSIKVNKIIINTGLEQGRIGNLPVGKNKRMVPLYLDGSLENYLLSSFNTTISKDSTDVQGDSITIYVDKFELDVNEQAGSKTCYHKFSYRFEYFDGKNHKKELIVSDSITTGIKNLKENFATLITIGIKKSSEKFISFYKNNKLWIDRSNVGDTLATKKAHTQNESVFYTAKDEKERLFKELFNTRVGFSANYLKGESIKNSYYVSFLYLSNKPKSMSEYGFNVGFLYLDIIDKSNLQRVEIYGMSSAFQMRYNFLDVNDGIFLSGTIQFIFGKTDGGNYRNNGLFFGGLFQESIGINISKYFSVSFGLFQLGISGSDFSSSDIGGAVTFCITGGMSQK